MATRNDHRTIRASTLLTVLLACLIGVAAAGCGSDGSGPNDVDRSFLQQMIPHHERAIAVARIGARTANDPRVRAFAARIVREQTPELATLRKAADGLKLDLTAGARHADLRISDGEVHNLRRLSGVEFDRLFLALHIGSENGAARMAETEIHGGRDDVALDVAKRIATAPRTEIPELRRLQASLTP